MEADQFRLRDLFKVDIILAFLFITIPMLPYTQFLLHGFVTTWIIFAIWLVIVTNKNSLLVKNLPYYKSEIIFLILFSLVVLFNNAFRFNNEKAFQYFVTFVNFILILFLEIYYGNINFKYKQSIIFLCILSLGIQAAISIPYLLTSGTYVARLYSNGSLESSDNLEAMKNGIGNNGIYTSGATILFAGLAIANGMSIFFKYITYFCLISIFLSISVSAFLAPFFLISIGIAMLLYYFRKRFINVSVFAALIFLSFIVYVFYINYLSNTNIIDPVTNRIQGFIHNITERGLSPDADVTGRTDLAATSLNTFQQHPFLGIGIPPSRSYNLIGEHMPWVDYLASFGIIGFSPLIIYFSILFYKNKDYYFHKRGRHNNDIEFYNKIMFICFVLFMLSNFISPMITVPNSYILLIFLYTSPKKTYRYKTVM